MLLNVKPAPSHWDWLTSLWDSLEVLVVLMETVEMVRVLFGAESRAVSADTLAPSGLVQHQEDQTMQKQGVEESNGPSRLIGENHTSQAQSCFIPGAEAKVSTLTLLLAEGSEWIQSLFVLRGVTHHCVVTTSSSSRVALQEFDFLVEFDVVCSQAVQLVLQSLHGLLHGAILSFQLLVAGAEPLPLAGDDGEQRVHLALRQLRMGAQA